MTISSIGGPGGMLPIPAERDAELRAASRALEGVFLAQMFKAMRATVPEGGIFEMSPGESMFVDMMDERVAETMAQGTDDGLGDALYQQLRKRIVEAGTNND